MPDDRIARAGGDDPAEEIAALRAAIELQRTELQAERRRAHRWEREAVLRASTVAGSLTARVLAAQRLATVVERNLTRLTGGGSSAPQELRDALEFFHEVVDDPAPR